MAQLDAGLIVANEALMRAQVLSDWLPFSSYIHPLGPNGFFDRYVER